MEKVLSGVRCQAVKRRKGDSGEAQSRLSRESESARMLTFAPS